jgi:glycosyltransferase involved in cell wall biosynthesis
MKVCFPIMPAPQGGGNYVMLQFIRYLEGQGVSVTHTMSDRYDVLFTNHWTVPYTTVLSALRRNPNIRLVHRIDGSAQDYGRHSRSDAMQSRVNTLMDATIFQSNYARYATREKFHVIAQDGPVIYNPVDLNLFNPMGPANPKVQEISYETKLCTVSWSTNPRKGAQSVYAVAKSNPDIGFILAGNFPDAPPLPNLLALGVLGREELAATLRSGTAFLTFSENEACPNAVIEAMASGLPVLYHESGGTPEVVGECGEPVDIESFRPALDHILAKGPALAFATRTRAEQEFEPTKAFGQYLDTITAAIARPPVVSSLRRRILSWSPRQVAEYNAREWVKRLRQVIQAKVA